MFGLETSLSTGVGLGYIDTDTGTMALRGGLATDVWLTRNIAVGGEVGVLGQLAIFGTTGAAWTLMPEFAYRSYLWPKSYLLFVGSIGYVRNVMSLWVPCEVDCRFLDFGDTLKVASHSLGSSVQFGVIDQPGTMLFGLMLRGDLAGYPVTTRAPMHGGVTLNGVIGF